TIYPLGHPEKAVTVHGGEMVIAEHGHVKKPEKFDVKLVLATSPLITDFAPLANLPLIQTVMNEQVAEQQLAVTTSQPLIKDLINIVNVTDQSASSNPAVVEVRIETPTPSPTISPTITPVPTPTKFGTPSTITSPNPYVITSGTTITTDPSITTNGVTDYGKIYRGRSIDGQISAWAFGSTSAFDTASGFDALIGDGSGAAFKFTALQLNGDPTIDTANGEINLGLIAVNSITSGGPGGVLTFEGIRGLLLATQDGPITLGPGISFSGLHDLTIYARGSSSDLTLGSDISTTSQVSLFAQRDLSMTSSITTDDLYVFVGRNVSIDGEAGIHAPTITLFAGQNLNWSGQTSDETAFTSSGNVSISAAQMLNIANDLTIIRRNGGITSGLNILLYAGTDLVVGGNLSIATDISNLETGANIDVLATRNLTVGR